MRKKERDVPANLAVSGTSHNNTIEAKSFCFLHRMCLSKYNTFSRSSKGGPVLINLVISTTEIGRNA